MTLFNGNGLCFLGRENQILKYPLNYFSLLDILTCRSQWLRGLKA